MTAVAFQLELERKGCALRPATGEDRAFQRALFAAGRTDAAFLAQWPEARREAFLDSQFRLQDIHYRRYFGAADVLIVERDGVPVGRVVLDRTEADWRLVDIGLMPSERGRGLGGALLKAILDAAAAHGATAVSLQVEAGNRARRLYERLGFGVRGRQGAHTLMSRKTPQSASSAAGR